MGFFVCDIFCKFEVSGDYVKSKKKIVLKDICIGII